MKVFIAIVSAAVLAAALWGVAAESRPVQSREQPHGIEVDSAWYSTLPTDPAAATEAFLQRVPVEMSSVGCRASVAIGS